MKNNDRSHMPRLKASAAFSGTPAGPRCLDKALLCHVDYLASVPDLLEMVRPGKLELTIYPIRRRYAIIFAGKTP